MTNKNQTPSVSNEEWVGVDLILKVTNSKDMAQLLLTVHSALLKAQSENVEMIEADIVVIDPETYEPLYEDDQTCEEEVMYPTDDPNTFYSEKGFYSI